MYAAYKSARQMGKETEMSVIVRWYGNSDGKNTAELSNQV